MPRQPDAMSATNKAQKLHEAISMTTRKKASAIALFAILFGGFCAQAQPPASPLHTVENRSIALQELIQKEMAAGDIPGLQLAVVQKGALVFSGAYGEANKAAAQAVTKETLFTTNSISKAFAGVAAMQLVEAGKLDLDAPITQYLEGLPADWAPVSTRQLLTHMSGLPDIIDDNTRLLDGASPEQAWEKVQTLPMKFPPGAQYSYSQTGYVVLGKIIGKIAGQPYADFVRERQFKLAQLPFTRLGKGTDGATNLAALYTHLTLRVEDMKTVGAVREKLPYQRQEAWPDYLYPAGGVQSTATDLAAWVMALQAHRLVSKESLEQLWKPQALKDGTYRGFSRTINGYGLGWPVVRRAAHPAVAPVGGARAALFIYPNDDLTVIVLTNLMGASPEKFVDRIASIYVPGLADAVK